MRTALLIAVLGVGVLVVPVDATIINVPGDYPTIQAGIDSSSDGDTVLVQPDTYYENINFDGHNITLGSLFLTTGETSYISSTIIDGDSSGSVVIFGSGEDSTTVLMGFTIRNGRSGFGGGVNCSGSSPLIINNLIVNNHSYMNGGGVYCNSSHHAVIRSNVIRGNSSESYGGGIYCTFCSSVICNNIISENTSNAGGGVCCANNSNPIIRNNIIRENLAEFGGGICCTYFSTPTIINSTIVGNSATVGGGIVCNRNGNAILTNSILWENVPQEVYFAPIFDTNSITVSYSDIQGGLSGIVTNNNGSVNWLEGNIEQDPLFCDPENDDFHLQDSIDCGDPNYSPCIDTGHPDSLDVQLDCDHGLGTSRADMGAYGGNSTGWVGIQEDRDWEYLAPKDFSLYQNYPNPFNASTVLRYSIPQPGEVRLVVYNVLGRKVMTLFEGVKQAGTHSAMWEVGDVSSGIYFAVLSSGDRSVTVKMVLLK